MSKELKDEKTKEQETSKQNIHDPGFKGTRIDVDRKVDERYTLRIYFKNRSKISRSIYSSSAKDHQTSL